MSFGKRTAADRLGSLYITMRMPPWIWNYLTFQCRTCANRGGLARDQNGARWPTWDRDEMRAMGMRQIVCAGGTVLLAVPFDLLGWDERGGCLLHEVRPEWDAAFIGEPLHVQDLTGHPMRPLSACSRSQERGS